MALLLLLLPAQNEAGLFLSQDHYPKQHCAQTILPSSIPHLTHSIAFISPFGNAVRLWRRQGLQGISLFRVADSFKMNGQRWLSICFCNPALIIPHCWLGLLGLMGVVGQNKTNLVRHNLFTTVCPNLWSPDVFGLQFPEILANTGSAEGFWKFNWKLLVKETPLVKEYHYLPCLITISPAYTSIE